VRVCELEKSAEGNVLSRYQLEAGIAACHCLAPKYQDTDWARILDLYDLLVGFNNSPIVYLNRAVALARVEGPEAGIRAIGQIRGERLEQYYLLHAVLGEFHAESGNPGAAAQCFRKALELTQIPSKAF
jgi:RNA polymerase sigma-70 factor (ECF subfamily)